MIRVVFVMRECDRRMSVAPAHQIMAKVGCDGEQPCREFGLWLISLSILEHANERFLREIESVTLVSNVPIDEAYEWLLPSCHQFIKCSFLSVSKPEHDLCVIIRFCAQGFTVIGKVVWPLPFVPS
jgi:hypothetical protein